jgi:hypothetical protein
MLDYGVTSGDSLRQRYNAMVNLPLVDEKLALRVVGFYRDGSPLARAAGRSATATCGSTRRRPGTRRRSQWPDCSHPRRRTCILRCTTCC